MLFDLSLCSWALTDLKTEKGALSTIITWLNGADEDEAAVAVELNVNLMGSLKLKFKLFKLGSFVLLWLLSVNLVGWANSNVDWSSEVAGFKGPAFVCVVLFSIV